MARMLAKLVLQSGSEEVLVVEAEDEQFAFSSQGLDDSEVVLWIDMDDVDDLVAFLLAMKEG